MISIMISIEPPAVAGRLAVVERRINIDVKCIDWYDVGGDNTMLGEKQLSG